MPPTIRWIAAALGLLLAGVLVDTARAAPGESLQAALAPFLAPTVPGAPIQSAILLQRRDCSGNLRVLDLLHRGPIRHSMRLAVIWYAGPVADSTVIRALLPAWTAAVPLRPVPSSALRELRRLGHRESPTVIVLDPDGRVRLVTRSPRSLREFAGLRTVIEGLTWIEEL